MNLAILGPRASGKTSLLNMITLEARQRLYCVARVDLNEGDIRSELFFFYKIFDSIFHNAVDVALTDEFGDQYFAFGGRDGRTYETYHNMTTTYVVPEDKK